MTGLDRHLYAEAGPVRLLLGDAAQVLAMMPDHSVDCMVTSPPYWGLRDYGTGAFTGGEPACPHTADLVCGRCGAVWTDPQQGLEPTLAEYLDRLVAVFAQAARVLRPTGTLWLNLGDCYTAGTRRGYDTTGGKTADRVPAARRRTALPGKNLIGVPWRAAFALQESGWILRNAIVWAKTNPMPSSVKDRFTTTYEHLFLLTRSSRYWFDLDPVRVPHQQTSASGHHPGAGAGRWGQPGRSKHDNPGIQAAAAAVNLRPTGARHTCAHPRGRNPGDVWALPTRPYHGAHVAPFPVDLPLRAIAAGCPPGGHVCDPYSGAATTGLAALRLGRQFTGIDIHAGHHKQALKRLQPHLPS